MSLNYLTSILQEERMMSGTESFVTGFRDLCSETARELMNFGITQRYFTLCAIVRKFEEFAEENEQEETEENIFLRRELPKTEWHETVQRISEIKKYWLDQKPAVVISENGIARMDLVRA